MNHPTFGFRRIFLVFWVIAGLLLSSCGTLFPTPEPVTITFGYYNYDQAYYESLLPGFQEKYPNITVELKPLRNEPDFSTDVTVVSWMATIDTTEIFDNLLPLDSFLSEEKTYSPADFYPGTLDAFAFEGKQYAIPQGVDPYVMYYNKDLFDRYGVAYPQPGWDWTDFLDKAQSLRDPEYTIYGFAPLNDHLEALILIYQHGGSLTDGLAPTLNTKLNIEAIRWYVSLFRDYNVAPTDEQITSELGAGGRGVYYGLLNGKVAMFVASLSMHGGRIQGIPAWTFKWGAVPLPHDENAFTISFIEALGVTRNSEHPDASWKWIQYVNSQPHSRLLPARVSLAESPEYAELVGDELATAGRQSMQNALLTTRQNLSGLMNIVELFSLTMDSLVNQDLVVQDEMDKAQAQAEQALP